MLLPSKILLKQIPVLRIIAETSNGSFALLPQRLDCVAALIPGILRYQTTSDATHWLAVDEGILLKTGTQVFVSVRRAVISTNLAQLQHLVEQEYQSLNAEEQNMRSVMAKLESGFLHRFASFDKA